MTMITDEEVEAGAIAVWRLIGDPDLMAGAKWEDVHDDARKMARTIARAILQAADTVRHEHV